MSQIFSFFHEYPSFKDKSYLKGLSRMRHKKSRNKGALMSNEFNGTENDQAWVALTANDPAQHLAKPELDSLKVSVLSEAIKLAPISKRSWLAPVAVAASVALFVGGGAGYTIAAQSSSNSSNTISAPAVEMGSAAGAQDEKMSSSAIWGGRPYLEAGAGISDNRGKQIGYTFDASDVDRKVQLQLIADVFNIEGKISGSKKDGFMVGDQNYVKATAQTSGSSWDLSQMVTWSYNDSSVSPQYCGENLPMYSNKSSGDLPVSETDIATPEPMPTVVPEPMPTVVPEPMPTVVSEPMPTIEPVPAPSECVQPSGSMPTDDSALSFAKEKFSALGFDSTSANWSVSDGGGMWGYSDDLAGAFKLVTAKKMIDGLDSKQSWTMTIGPDETILSANGFYSSFIPTSEYEIVGAKTAIERSQNGLWFNLPPQEVYKEGMIYPMEIGMNANPTAVTKNSAGQPILDANVDRVTIASAEKSLTTWYLNDGSMILLPAYLLSKSDSKDSRQWLQLSIADEYVDFN
jgi:hypothetical protein